MAICHGDGVQLDVESLRTLLAVLDHGGMTRAADALDLTQSAVSWKIKRLEERVGRPLLLREGHGVRPTPSGQSILDDARTIVEVHDRAVVRLRNPEALAPLDGHVRIGCSGDVDELLVVSALGRFTRAQPAITFEFVVDDAERLTERLAHGDLDVAALEVIDEHVEPDDEVLWRHRLVWATSRAVPYEAGEVAPIIVPLITVAGHCPHRRLGERLLADAGIEYTVACSVSSTSGVLAAITAGLGVGVVIGRHVGGDVIEWPRAIEVEPLPHVNLVLRGAPEPQSPSVDAIVEVLAHELSGPSPVTRGAG